MLTRLDLELHLCLLIKCILLSPLKLLFLILYFNLLYHKSLAIISFPSKSVALHYCWDFHSLNNKK